jgi:Flp pilus assembly protein TadD
MMTPASPPPLRRRLLLGGAALPLALMLALAGCAKPQDKTDPAMTGAIEKPMTAEDFNQAVTYWAQRYQKNEKDRDTGLNYAAALRRVDRTDQAVAVLQKMVIFYPNDREVLAAYGKALAAKGDFSRAMDALDRAQTPDNPDWRLYSAKAAILDQLGRSDEARTLYDKALALAPNEPTILSNYAMSYVLTGDLAAAEKMLRKAILQPGADSRVRQNLALVVGLQGRFDEAEKIAKAELSPDQAAANIAYLRAMLSDQQNTWQKLKTAGGTG